MRRIVLLISMSLLCIISLAQVPESFNYQAIPRDNGAIYPGVTMYIRTSILSGSPSGSSVYTETFNPTTTSLGLLNLQIGQGAPVSGDFTSIDWTSGSYYLKVEIDPTGVGTVYTDMGTTQLLSVPYALHAKTAENIIGTINETDPNAVLLSGDQTISGNKTFTGTTTVLTPVNTTDAATKAYVDNLLIQIGSPDKLLDAGFTLQQLVNGGYSVSELLAAGISIPELLTAGASVSDLLSAGISVSELLTAGASVNDLLTAGASVSELIIEGVTTELYGTAFQGGIIAYILQSGDAGYVAGEAHGLIAPTSDQGSDIEWYNGNYITTGATATALGTGNSNTNIIISSQGTGNYAAQICAELVLDGYSDWYLPSQNELNILYSNKYSIGNFLMSPSLYWSSSEVSINGASAQSFYTGGISNYTKNYPMRVRAIRAF